MISLSLPPYSPDSAPADFAPLSKKMKIQLKGRRSDTIVEIRRESQKVLDTLTDLQKTYRTNSRSGRNIGSSVLLCKRTIVCNRKINEEQN
ncbi:hypothetical protein C0J45_17147 [Silurus meridionalis]|nr:hypothetical protein C0J45_17147 [Silurus meridionalis]